MGYSTSMYPSDNRTLGDYSPGFVPFGCDTNSDHWRRQSVGFFLCATRTQMISF